MLLLQNHRPRQ